jgi:DNA-binding transcriptional MerR regulator
LQNKLKLKFFPNVVESLRAILPGGISVQDFSVITKTSEYDSRQILDEFVKKGIGKKNNDNYDFEAGDKLKIALELIQNGFPLDDISAVLDWRDFEGLTGEILSEKNFAVMKNLVLTKPRMEIDVVGIRLGVAMLIDCKHWKRYTSSALNLAVKKQIERTRQYVSKTQNAIAVPVIVTLYQDKVNFIDNVPIVPIFQLSLFLDEFFGNNTANQKLFCDSQ